MTMIFRVDPGVFQSAPDYIVGCVLARGVDNTLTYPELDALLDDAEESALIAYAGVDLKQLQQIAVWRTQFSAQGWSPSRFPASVEALLKRVARGDRLPRINPVVDLANAAVLRFGVPIGTHDIDTFGGNALTVRPATLGDTFLPMGTASEREDPDPGEIVYVLGNEVRTRRWVWRQSLRALVGPQATNLFFPIDGFAPSTSEYVKGATAFIAAVCRDQLRAEVFVGLVDAAHPEFGL